MITNKYRNIIENTHILHDIFINEPPALFMIRIGVGFFLISKLLPMNIRYWRPISHVKYRMEYNHASE